VLAVRGMGAAVSVARSFSVLEPVFIFTPLLRKSRLNPAGQVEKFSFIIAGYAVALLLSYRSAIWRVTFTFLAMSTTATTNSDNR
jgi:hypothetical protein